MRKFLFILFLPLLFSVAEGCSTGVGGRSTVNLTAPGINALHAAAVVKDLDVIRDIAINAEASKIISTLTASKIISWHKVALTTIQQTPNGWKPTVLAGLGSLSSGLSQDEKKIFEPYINSAIAIIKAVIQ